MGLFADGVTCTIDDLTDQDAGLLDVAQNCAINVTTKMRLAHEEIATELQLWLERPRGTADALWAPVTRLGQVVATPPLRRWEVMMALSLVYRDAYFSQLVDRYQGKWEEYSRLSRTAYDRFVASGVGLVNDPVEVAAAPVLGTVAGPQKGGTFYASVAWVNGAGQQGAPSAASSLTVADGTLMTIAPSEARDRAAGFNVYAGTSLGAMYLQNSTVLPAGIPFLYVPGGMAAAKLPSEGQKPDYTRPLARLLLRG